MDGWLLLTYAWLERPTPNSFLHPYDEFQAHTAWKGEALRIYAHLSAKPAIFGNGRGPSQMLFQHFLRRNEQTMHPSYGKLKGLRATMAV